MVLLHKTKTISSAPHYSAFRQSIEVSNIIVRGYGELNFNDADYTHLLSNSLVWEKLNFKKYKM